MASKTGLKEPELIDVSTGEVIDGEGAIERLKRMATKGQEITAAEGDVAAAKETLKTAKDELDQAQAVVRTLEGELADLVAGQKLLFE